MCSGNPDPRLNHLLDSRKGVLRDQDKKVVAYVDEHLVPVGNKNLISSTVRHAQCHLIIKNGPRCTICIRYRKALRSMLSRHRKQEISTNRTDISSHVNFRFLTTPEKSKRFDNARVEGSVRRIECEKNRAA